LRCRPWTYVAACLRALEEEPGAANVGGWCSVGAAGPWGEAIGVALASRFGVGNPRIWRRPAATAGRVDVDTVPFGCWRASTLRAAGGWNEAFARNEDFELNNRLRRSGGRIVFDPEITSVYHPRESPGALARQYRDYGRSKALMLASDPASLRPRQLAPVALSLTLVCAVLPGRAGRVARTGAAAYVALLGAVAARDGGGWRTPAVLATMHLSWAGGLARGAVELAVRQRPR
jgi:hypothetical protein